LSATPLGELFEALAGGLAQPRHAWEAASIVAALLVAAAVSRAAVHALERRHKAAAPGSDERLRAERAMRAGRVIYPLAALALLWAAEGLLRWRHVLASAADARLLRLAISLMGALAVVRILFSLLRRVLRSTPLTLRIERAIGVLAVVGISLYATGLLEDVVQWLASFEIPLGNTLRVSLWSLLVGSATTLVALLAAMWLGSIIEDRLGRETALEPNLRTVLGRVARALLLVVALMVALALSGIDLTVLSVFSGALGVGLAFGLQRIAGSYVSGFILLLDRSLRIGDVVAVDKYFGQVTQISTRYTVLRSPDGTEAVIPNEMLIGSPVVNYTLQNRRISLSVDVTVGPDTDVRHALALMVEAARSQSRVLADPGPTAQLKEFQAGNLLLELSFWIADPENGRQNAQSAVALAVHESFRAHGLGLAAPRGDYRISAPPDGPAALPGALGAPTTISPTAPASVAVQGRGYNVTGN
jgi:small-conductance mechanosensitive channel